MTIADLRWALAYAAVVALLIAPSAALAQPPNSSPAAKNDGAPNTKSPPAAIRQFRDAVAFQDRGVYDLAADEWQSFLKKFPADPLAAKARHYLGVCELLQKNFADAVTTFERVIREHPESGLADASYLNLGLAQYSLAQTGKTEFYDQAAATLQTLIEKFPKSKEVSEALYYRGESLYARNKKDVAARSYKQLVDQFTESPHRAEGLYALGVTQQDLGNNKLAGTTFDTFLKAYPQHPLRAEVILRRAESLFAEGKHSAAEQWFASAAASKDFAHADLAAMRQAACLVAQGKTAEAAALYAAIPDRFPNSAHRSAALIAAGNNYYQLADWDASAKAFNAVAISDDPLALEATHGLVRTYLKQKQPDQALTALERVLADAKGSKQEPQLMLDRGDTLYEINGRRPDAIVAYAALAEQYPAHELAPQALYMAAFASLGQGDYVKAEQYGEEFLKAHAEDPLAADVHYIVAEAALQQKRYAAATAAYRELLAKFPKHAEAASWKVRLGLSLFLDEQLADVVATLSPVVSQLKPVALAAEGQFLLGSAQAELGEHAAAVKSLLAALADAPTGPRADEALLTLATAYQAEAKLDEACDTLRRLTTEFPHSPRLERAYLLLGEYEARAGNFAAATQDYRKLLKTWPQGALASHAMFGLASVELEQQDFAAAETTLTRYLELFPQEPTMAKARYARAVARERQQKYTAALDDLTELVSNPPAADRLDALYLQGLCYAGLQRWEPAADAFRSVLDADPNFSGADKVLYELAWALKSDGHEDKAIAAFAQLAEQHPMSPLAAEGFYHLGEADYAAKEFARAAEHYRAAHDKAGHGGLGEKAAHKRGWALYQGGELAAATAAFRKQLTDYPEGELAADALFMVGESLFGQNLYEAAVETYQKSFTRPSENPVFQALAYLHAGQALAQQQKWEASQKLLDDAIVQFGDSAYLPELQYESGWACQNLGQTEEAVVRYEEVIAQTDREVSARARFMLGEILFEKKQYKEAIRNFFKVAYGYGYPKAPDALQVWQANASYEAARCFEVLKMVDQARKSYQEVVDKYPQSDKVPLAKNRLEALGS